LRVRLKSYLKAANFVELVPVRSVVVSPSALREDVGDIEELAASIKSKGLIEPIIVRPVRGKFEIIAGHRRFQACRMNRFVEVPAVVMDIGDREAFEVSLEENIHRKALDPIEEARAFSIYVRRYGYGSITELAERIGKSEEYVSHRILLLNLPDSIQSLVSRRLLTASNAWELTRVKDPSTQAALAESALKDGLTVKQLREAAVEARAEGFTRPPVTRPSEEKRAKVKKAASSALRIALIRIGDLIDSLDESDREAKEELLQFRLKVHGLLDRFAGRDTERDPLESEITGIVRRVFLENLNSGNLAKFSKLRSKHYTAFGDFPPYTLRDLNQTIVRDERITKMLHDSKCEIDDLRVTRFLGGAVATFRFWYDMRVAEVGVKLQSRVSFVFERADDGWSLVHEHWSPYELQHEVLSQVEREFVKHRIVP
jgi:ParB family chromosome partitioning protein